METKLTKDELKIICHALMMRESRLLDDVEAYKKQRNPDAVKDCVDSWRKTYTLHEKMQELLWAAS